MQNKHIIVGIALLAAGCGHAGEHENNGSVTDRRATAAAQHTASEASPEPSPSAKAATIFGYLKKAHGADGAGCGWIRFEDRKSSNPKLFATSDLNKIWFNINGEDKGFKLSSTGGNYIVTIDSGSIKIISGKILEQSEESESASTKDRFVFKSENGKETKIDLVGTCGA